MASEIIFLVKRSPEGGYTARAVGESIFTEAGTTEQLHEQLRDEVHCHFDGCIRLREIRWQFVDDEEN